MNKVAKFMKVSLEQYKKDCLNMGITGEKAEEIYNNIKLPKRATKGSAGYDFYIPYNVTLEPGQTAKIPTGIRCQIMDDWVLMLYPRSGLGFKYKMQLFNGVGVIDCDYFFSENEGHIFAKIFNDSPEGKTLNISAGTGFIQGVFTQFGIIEDDDADGIRNGGFGSTGM